ncbi:hypothetical protein DL766_002863 [Monosporascus sp. MC13-8B]|uniref:Uncharacterized protein n=1 Tax=Monosporascus cannonballus TaxID=155416 RepID=A0ABY0HEF9_9PEZI|nr:hypothetical protein DL762_002551 [Monosporascus cannonballus]RYO95196.1 hypothetical protein DL763_003764 [Monosporascus cannonballus]RYP34672.1 hypothetical protein DL766_002863 [Monosporascus sp. MC13-8B]
MADIYTTDNRGEYSGLEDLSTIPKANTVPAFPRLQAPHSSVRHETLQSHHQQAAMYGTSKRFISKDRKDLVALEEHLKRIEDSLDSTRAPMLSGSASRRTAKALILRYREARLLDRQASSFRAAMGVAHQPSKKLLDAMTKCARSPYPYSQAARMSRLSLTQGRPAFRQMRDARRTACQRQGGGNGTPRQVQHSEGQQHVVIIPGPAAKSCYITPARFQDHDRPDPGNFTISNRGWRNIIICEELTHGSAEAVQVWALQGSIEDKFFMICSMKHLECAANLRTRIRWS